MHMGPTVWPNITGLLAPPYCTFKAKGAHLRVLVGLYTHFIMLFGL